MTTDPNQTPVSHQWQNSYFPELTENCEMRNHVSGVRTPRPAYRNAEIGLASPQGKGKQAASCADRSKGVLLFTALQSKVAEVMNQIFRQS